MYEVVPRLVWLGHVGDVQNLQLILDTGIAALVDLALNEPPPPLPRELTYCRFPLVDGPGNRPELLRAAVESTAALLREKTPTLVYCSVGMSRSLVIAATAWAMVRCLPPEECLRRFAETKPHDVSPALWQEVVAACASLR